MVAPTRTPQARGVKCDLCKKILERATWLDQTKLAKDIASPQKVLKLIKDHDLSDCPCIPKNIQNLLVGSTHFEIHRLQAKALDSQIFKKQVTHYKEARVQHKEKTKVQGVPINDCLDHRKVSRFKVFANYNEEEREYSYSSCKHLKEAIDYWKIAMEDLTNPFNSKLALRLGLTHHVIYACYFFKFHRILDYQLKTANLLLNLFKSIEGVTTNAIIHASYLLVRSLLDCNQINLAKHYLKQATKLIMTPDKSSYELILLTCVACELNLLENKNLEDLNELANLAVVQKDDKLQHYYARTLALGTLIKYIHCYHPIDTDKSCHKVQCFEFFHTYRYICAIIRRCYENSFELILSEKESTKHKHKATSDNKDQNQQQQQILDHSWIRLAACDFVFSTYDHLAQFFSRAGIPEVLELLHNGLDLIAYRTGCYYWQTRVALIGASFDLLCDKYDHWLEKIDLTRNQLSKITTYTSDYTSDKHLIELLTIELEINSLLCENQLEKFICKDTIMRLCQNLRNCGNSLLKQLDGIELYDCRQNFLNSKVTSVPPASDESLLVFGYDLTRPSLICFKVAIASLLRSGETLEAKSLIYMLSSQIETLDIKILDCSSCQILLETILYFCDIDRSEHILLDSINLSSNTFFTDQEIGLGSIESQMSTLTLNSDVTESDGTKPNRLRKPRTAKKSRLPIGKRSKKISYDVSGQSDEGIRYLDTLDAIKQFQSISQEEILVCYLRNAEPCPDYLLYRRVHELMFSIRLKEDTPSVQNLNHHVLYHFTEASTSNSMRYRWMMFDEQRASPFEFKTYQSASQPRGLDFHNVHVNPDKNLKSLTSCIPEEYKLVQIRYILNRRTRSEHFIMASFDHRNDPIFVHHKSDLTSGDFLRDAQIQDEDIRSISTPNKLTSLIEEAKKTLFLNNHKNRSSARERLESDLFLLLNNIENDCLGPYGWVLCGKQQVGIILDKELEHIPFESLPVVRGRNQGLFRVPSLRIFHAIANRRTRVNAASSAYVLDPANNLAKTRERFESKLKGIKSWVGTIGLPPNVDNLENWLTTKDIYLFMGHGAGTAYYNCLCKGRGLSAMPAIKATPIVMGCSSGRVMAEGSRLESFGINWVFIFRGSPSYIGLLWDVTDTDIDKFLDSLLAKWMPSKWQVDGNQTLRGDEPSMAITDAITSSRLVCQFRYLVGSTPVTYGLPMVCSDSTIE